MIREVRLYGRGGQGVVTASRILAEALFRDGMNVQAFPFFGIERRGAPVLAFLRYGHDKITSRTYIQNPDIVLIFDETLLEDETALSGLKDDGMIILNAREIPENLKEGFSRIAVVDADKISIENLGRAIVNTVMCGAFAYATRDVSIDALTGSLECFFHDRNRMDSNRRALREGYSNTVLYP